MRTSKLLFILAYSLLLLLATSHRASGQVSDPIQYKLYGGSSLEYGCFGPCECPVAFSGPLRGTFTFYRTSVDPLFDHYALVNIDWTYTMGDSAPGTLRTVHVKGHGTYDVGGEVALTQRMVLELTSDGVLAQHFDSGYVPTRASFPGINIDVHAPTGICLDSILHVIAAPAGVAGVGPVTGARLIERAQPNPTAGALDILLTLPASARVRVDVIDVSGRAVTTLVDRELGAGAHPLRWDGRSSTGLDAGPGIFWIRARADGRLDEARIVRFR